MAILFLFGVLIVGLLYIVFKKGIILWGIGMYVLYQVITFIAPALIFLSKIVLVVFALLSIWIIILSFQYLWQGLTSKEME